MYLCGFLRLDLGICAQDLNKLGRVELDTLQGMAAVFAGQAGDGAPGSRIAVEKRLVPSRSISRGRHFGGPISKAWCSVRPFIRKIGSSGAKVPLGPLWEAAASPRVRASLQTLNSPEEEDWSRVHASLGKWWFYIPFG